LLRRKSENLIAKSAAKMLRAACGCDIWTSMVIISIPAEKNSDFSIMKLPRRSEFKKNPPD
jgi:hypothetical protein